MTALAGSIPRMMRPTLAQNYPRSGFPLEGKIKQQKKKKKHRSFDSTTQFCSLCDLNFVKTEKNI